MLCPIKVNSNTIELTVHLCILGTKFPKGTEFSPQNGNIMRNSEQHPSCYCVLDLLCATRFSNKDNTASNQAPWGQLYKSYKLKIFHRDCSIKLYYTPMQRI